MRRPVSSVRAKRLHERGGSLLGNTLPLGLLCHTADELLWVGGLTMLKIHFHSTFSYVSSFHPGQNSY